ncbi:MAG: hypothetical protein KJT03_17655, partial [Verrucomicrobiae bacterium]|nr:hypothetical protein [Verrucomicrobiae bacterium]
LFVTAGPDAGIIEYHVDQGPWQEQDLFTRWSSGLHIPWLHILAAELDAHKEHTLQVRISGKNHPDSTGHACRVVHLAVNGGKK